ncbi:hypothetical protein GCM10022254_61820 [Actinomadura meridiana]|uniref:Aminoglycoside phosphotransferase domain-containing protein n=1 Tax=Actinomadura meridiana TaxID=559626 RepID=A0ABP8CIL7_9ACTN
MTIQPAGLSGGPLSGACTPRPAGWLPDPLTTDPAEATRQAHLLLTAHHTGIAGPLRCLNARYRTAVFAVGDPPAQILKRHADLDAYNAEVVAYQLLAGRAVLPELLDVCDGGRTLVTTYLPRQANLAAPAVFNELLDLVARAHTVPVTWPPQIAAIMQPYTLQAALAGPAPEWIADATAWRAVLELTAGAHGPGHVPLGGFDLAPRHTRRDAAGTMTIIDGETMRLDWTGLPDVITLAYVAAEVASLLTPRQIRRTYLRHARDHGARWTDATLTRALTLWAKATGLHSLHGLTD